MKFSIVIPVFGTERFLPRCLDSLVAQTDADFEAIVVDDCSPGEKGRGTSAKDEGEVAEIVGRYDSRFRVVRHERNLSLLQARLTGLRAAQGDYVIPLDSDDYVLPGLVAELKKAAAKDVRRETGDERSSLDLQPSTFNHQPDVIVYQMMYDNGRKVTMPSVRYRDERLSGSEALDRLFSSRIQCGICGKAVRREVYVRAMEQLAVPADFYLNSSEDLCQTFPVLVNAQSVATLSYPGYRYWLNDDSLTMTLTDPVRLGKAAENTRRVFDTLADFVRRNGHDPSLLPRLEAFMRPTLRWYLGCLRDLPEADWRACVAELCRSFDPTLVAREAQLLITESRAYRLGRRIVDLLKRLSGRS